MTPHRKSQAFWGIVSLAALLPAAHPLLRPLVGVPSHLLWFSLVLPVAMIADRWGRRAAIFAVAVSAGLVVIGEQSFGAGYGRAADVQTTIALAVALSFANALVAGFAIFGRQVRRKFEALFQSGPVGIVRVSSSGAVVLENPRAATVLGRTEGSLVGQRLDALVHPPEDGALLRGGVDGSGPLLVVSVQGAPGRMVALTSVRLEADGDWQVVLQDFTEREQLQAQLIEAQKMEAVGRFAASVAHDFNNVLTAIRLSAEMALDDVTLESEAHELLLVVQQSADRATLLSHRLLTFGRQRAEQVEQIDVNQAIADLEPMLRRLVTERVHLGTALQPGIAPVSIDRGHLEQIVLNFVVNAADAMPEGGSVTIETSAPRGQEGELPQVCVAVVDTGTGIDAATRARMFEPFYTTKEPGRGTGLGLATVAALVQKARGRVEVDSVLGSGTTFRVRLPASVGHAEQRPPPAPLALPGGNEVVLVVEDEALVRMAARRSLERLGYRVVEAQHGRDALVAIERQAVDLVVSDVVMPELDGVGFLRALRARGQRQPVLFVTGYGSASLSALTAADHPYAVMQKPFTNVELAAEVRRVLDRRAELSGPPT